MDVLGITEKMDEFMVDLSLFLGWPLEWFTYKMMKLNTQKPDILELLRWAENDDILEDIASHLSRDNLWYDYAEEISKENREKRYSKNVFGEYLKCFEFLQSKVNSSCKFQSHSLEIDGKTRFNGFDCY